MNVIMSIKPEYASKIYSGEKWVELRKDNCKKLSDCDVVYLYETLPVKRITGKFTIQGRVFDFPDTIWKRVGDGTGLTKEQFDKYTGRKPCKTTGIYAFIIDKAFRFKEPIDPAGFWHATPRSFTYVERQNYRPAASARSGDDITHEELRDQLKNAEIEQVRTNNRALKYNGYEWEVMNDY